MRSPEARALLDEVLRAARRLTGKQLGDVIRPEDFQALTDAVAAYDAFCNERHYSLSLDLVSSPTAIGYITGTTSKADHFQLPLGRENPSE